MIKKTVFNSLEDTMFLAGIPLLVPVVYSLILNEGIWFWMFLSVLLLLLPGFKRIASSCYLALKEKALRFFSDPSTIISWKFQSLFELDLLESIRKKERLTNSEALAVAAVCWMIVPVITAVPYWMHGYSITDGLFDSFSGWTATGLSTIDNPELLPPGFILFRSFTLWIGGAGIILFALLVIGPPGSENLMMAEGREGMAIGVRNTVKIIWVIYLFLTLCGVFMLLMTGLGLFNSVNITMAGIATGGFLPSSLLVFSFEQKIVMTLIMMAGATSFAMFWELGGKRKLEAIMKNTEFKMMLFLIALFAFFLVLTSNDSVVDAAFDVTAAISGTGFAIRDISVFSDLAKYVLLLLMISGGCSGSTTGALKLWRSFALGKTIINRIKATFMPKGAVQVVKVNGKVLNAAHIEESGTFVFLYLLVLIASAGAVMATGYSAIDSLFAVASAMGNVGLATFNMFLAPLSTKWILIIL
ncbi:MAG: potassium transporter TrkG, partial [Candidatus Micrarchaeota archaeon]